MYLNSYKCRFLKENGVNLASLSNLKTQEEKDAYIIESMKMSYREDLNEFIKKHNAKLSQAKNYEKSLKLKKQKSKKEKVDIFQWLNVQTP